MYYIYRLTPPRATFPADMNPDEARAMKEHVAYWTGLVKKGIAVLFGPVADPAGTWGMAVFEADDDGSVLSISTSDPVIARDLGFKSEVFPMPNAVVRK